MRGRATSAGNRRALAWRALAVLKAPDVVAPVAEQHVGSQRRGLDEEVERDLVLERVPTEADGQAVRPQAPVARQHQRPHCTGAKRARVRVECVVAPAHLVHAPTASCSPSRSQSKQKAPKTAP